MKKNMIEMSESNFEYLMRKFQLIRERTTLYRETYNNITDCADDIIRELEAIKEYNLYHEKDDDKTSN